MQTVNRVVVHNCKHLHCNKRVSENGQSFGYKEKGKHSVRQTQVTRGTGSLEHGNQKKLCLPRGDSTPPQQAPGSANMSQKIL